MPKKLTKEESKAYANLILMELMDNLPDEDKVEFSDMFSSQIIQKRIEAFELSIEFNIYALTCVSILCYSPGGVVILLIDCLNAKLKKVTVANLTDIYPMGFYTQDELDIRIDEIKNNPTLGWNKLY